MILTNYHRKHAIRVLNNHAALPEHQAARRSRLYDEGFEALITRPVEALRSRLRKRRALYRAAVRVTCRSYGLFQPDG